jgi:hypothetical protein
LHGDTAFFAGRRMSSNLDRQVHGHECAGHGRPVRQPDGSTIVHDYHCVPSNGQVDGTWTVYSLEPGLPVTVLVSDALGEELVRQTLTTPPTGEHAEVEVQVAATRRTLRCVVVDADGAAIPNVRVVATSERRENLLAHDADGSTFVLDGLFAKPDVMLVVRAEGFVTARVAASPGTAEPQTIRLQRGVAVLVRVVDEGGAAIDVNPVLGAAGDHRDSDDLGPGQRRFRNLPPGETKFACTIAGRTYEVSHDTRQPTAELRVPRHGSVVVAGRAAWPAPAAKAHHTVVVRAAESDDVVTDVSGEAAQLLLPGRYRLALYERCYVDGERHTRPLGLTAEITVTAGETVTATLR